MKQLLSLLFSLFVCLTLSAQTEVTPSLKAPLASKSLLLDITKVGGTLLVAVGERGHILTSRDAINWQQANVPIQSTLTSVFFINNSLGWAVGHDSSILNTRDGGKNWQIQQYLPAMQKPLLDVVFKDENNGIAIGAYGQFYRTVDGGENWSFEFHDEFLLPEDADYLNELKLEDNEAYLDERASILPHFNRMYRAGRTLYMVGEIGLIAKSNDFGLTWEAFDEIYNGSFFDVKRTHGGALLISGLRGNVFRSTENGISWKGIPTNSTSSINSIVLGDEGYVYLLGNNGAFFISEDDGVSFISRTQDDGKPLISGVWFNGKIVAVSDVGVKTVTTLVSSIAKGNN